MLRGYFINKLGMEHVEACARMLKDNPRMLQAPKRQRTQATTVQDIFQMGLRPLGSFIDPSKYTEPQLISLWNATVALFAVVPGDQASINEAKQEVAQCLELMRGS